MGEGRPQLDRKVDYVVRGCSVCARGEWQLELIMCCVSVLLSVGSGAVAIGGLCVKTRPVREQAPWRTLALVSYGKRRHLAVGSGARHCHESVVRGWGPQPRVSVTRSPSPSPSRPHPRARPLPRPRPPPSHNIRSLSASPAPTSSPWARPLTF